MAKGETLRNARANQNDEFYTLYEDIEKEINKYLDFDKDTFKDKIILCPCDDPEWSNFTKYFILNFKKLGIKKIISTTYAPSRASFAGVEPVYEVETKSPNYDPKKTYTNGKVYILERRDDKDVGFEDLQWHYLEGDGDFRSDEVKAIRDSADVIVTNPPFSLFREFVAWIMEAKKKFLIIGNVNCIAYKDIFPLLKDNVVWLGTGIGRWISGFIVPDSYELKGTEARITPDGKRVVSTNSCLWLTNLDHGRRHQPLSLMTMADNKKYSKHKAIRENGYQKYDNYNAIDVPFSDAIPSDYDGLMGVPLTFMDKYCPDQFQIIGPAMGWTSSTMSEEWKKEVGYISNPEWPSGTSGYAILDGVQQYHRILIKRR